MSEGVKKAVHGWVCVDKPVGINSTKVVSVVRRAFGIKKVGHAGTLDPLASGVLPIAIGEATKTVPYIQDREKVYSFTLSWGSRTSTDDLEGEVVETSDVRVDKDSLIKIVPEFTGQIEQIPPAYSAIKINGKRAYDLARSGAEFEMKSRSVEIFSIDVLEHDGENTTFRVTCGKGTYIRSLARDIAKAAGSCGHVSMLRRERVGGFSLDNSILLDKLENKCISSPLADSVLSICSVLDDIPALVIGLTDEEALRQGRACDIDAEIFPSINSELKLALAVSADERPVGIVSVGDTKIEPKRVFNIFNV